MSAITRNRSSIPHDLIHIVNASFQPALVIDKRGRVRHANDASALLFDLDRDSPLNHVDALMVFVSSTRDFVVGDFCWKDVYIDLADQHVTAQWNVKCTHQQNENVFSATMNVAKVSWTDGNAYVLGYVNADEMERIAKEKEENKTLDLSSDPMMAVDQMGHVLMLNQAAVDTIDWCEPELVGQHISLGLRNRNFASHPDPIIGVDQDGTIVSMNSAAVDDFSWCSKDLIGLNLSKLGATRRSSEEIHVNDEGTKPPFPQLSSWFATKKDEVKRRKGPEVLRIYIRDRSDSTQKSKNRLPLTIQSGLEDHQQRDSVMSAIVEAAFDPMFLINEQGLIQMVNRAAGRQFRYKCEELLGCNISMIMGGEHAENHDKFLKRYLETGISKLIGQKRELTARRSDGTEFPIDLGVIEVAPFQGDQRLFCGFVHDLSSIKKKERITLDITEASLDPIFLISECGTIRMANTAATTQFGFDHDEFIGHNISLIVGGGHDKHHSQYIRKYLATGNTNVIGNLRQVPARRKDGSEFPIQLAVVEMKSSEDEERTFCGFVHSVTAVTSKKRIVNGFIESSLDGMF
jgi:PAS domain S-box-containing protein